MPVHDDLGNRMKSFYEEVPKTRLMRRTPVCVRIDGKSFHSWTKGFKRPFDEILIKSMQDTMKYLCENIQGCVLGYCQSDEISLLLIDYQQLNSQAFFDYEIQKICSITASIATMAFNKSFLKNTEEWFVYNYLDDYINKTISEEDTQRRNAYNKAAMKGAMFDSRCFNIPKEEVTNYFYWRQLDATRNSIQMVGQANFSHTQLHGKSCNDIQDMLHEKCGINWNDFPTYQKRGSCCIKEQYEMRLPTTGEPIQRSRWIIDNEIPIFRGDGREYIERMVNVREFMDKPNT